MSFGSILVVQQIAERELRSARPDAPVVPHIEPTPRTVRTRLAVAGLLERAAAAVSPTECVPAH